MEFIGLIDSVKSIILYVIYIRVGRYMLNKLMVHNKKNIFQILCIILILFSVVAIILAKLSPTVGYESSIYKSTPILVWVSIVSLIIGGLVIIIDQIFNEKLEQSNLWLVGFFLLFLSYTICISLDIIRGYFMWCMEGDPATHIGYINQILYAGHFPAQLFYPALHIYVSQVCLVSNINIIILHKILPLIFGILYIPFVYLFLKSVFSDKNQIILSTIAGSTLINGSYLNFTPNGLSNLFFPLLLFILLKSTFIKDVRWELLILIMAFFYPIFHPVPTLVFILIIITLLISRYILNRTNNIIINKDRFLRFKQSLLILVAVWSITWISSFYVWDMTIKNIYTLINEGGPSNISLLVENINYARGYGYNVMEQVLKIIGGPLAYILIAIISLPIVWKNKDKEKLNNLLSLCSPLLSLCLLIIILYFLNLLFGPLRVVTYTTIISSLFVGYLLNYLINKIKTVHKPIFNFGFIGLILLLFIVWINGILILYPSPYTLGTSHQTTLSEVDGINWLFGNKNLDLKRERRKSTELLNL